MNSLLATRTTLAALSMVAFAALYPMNPAPLRTGGTPISSLPITIVESGLYYWEENLQGPAGSTGIHVMAPNVTIDLRGYTLSGPGASDDVSGVHGYGRFTWVKNGTLKGWGRSGYYGRRDCRAENFQEIGFHADDGVTMVDCYATGASPEWTGYGFSMGNRASIRGCVIDHHVQTGIKMRRFGSISNTRIDRTGLVAILAEEGARIVDCTVSECGDEDYTGGAAVQLGENAFVRGLMIGESAGTGLLIAGELGGNVEGSMVFNSGIYGMDLGSGVSARNNLVTGSLDAGILARGDRLRIQDNTLDSNGEGLRVMGKRTLVIGNPFGPLKNHSWAITGSTPQANFKTPLYQ